MIEISLKQFILQNVQEVKRHEKIVPIKGPGTNPKG